MMMGEPGKTSHVLNPSGKGLSWRHFLTGKIPVASSSNLHHGLLGDSSLCFPTPASWSVPQVKHPHPNPCLRLCIGRMQPSGQDHHAPSSRGLCLHLTKKGNSARVCGQCKKVQQSWWALPLPCLPVVLLCTCSNPFCRQVKSQIYPDHDDWFGAPWQGTAQVVLVVKNLSANAGDIWDVGSILGSGRSFGIGNGNPFQYSCLENPMDRGPCGPQGRQKSDMTEAT